ncbi:MAG: type VI secretion system protein TssA, partial [Fibrobacterota bacterium]
ALPGNSPFGRSITHDSDYEAVKSEIGKLGNVDADLVEKSSLKILTQKSKDIRVLSFLAYAMLRKENWEGLADVFGAFVSLAETDFDKLHPEREKAKQLALAWMSESRFSDLAAQARPNDTDHPNIVRLENYLDKLREIISGKYPENPPFPFAFQKDVSSWSKACAPPAPSKTPEDSPLKEQTEEVPSVTASPIYKSTEPYETAKQAQLSLKKAARFLIEQEPLKPMGYRLSRMARWDILEQAPPSDNSRTQLQPPPEQQKKYLQNLVSQNEWKSLLNKAEPAFLSGANHLWLDLQRLSATACKMLETQYTAVHQAILSETRVLVERIPELLHLCFSDGSPFCDSATIEWISGDVLHQKRQSAAEDKAGRHQSDDFLEQISLLVSSGKFHQAITRVHRRAAGSSTAQEKFIHTVMIAEILTNAKKWDLATNVLERLDRQISFYRLDNWDPDLAVRVWGLLFSAYKSSSGKSSDSPEAAEKLNRIKNKICRLDPAKAFMIT